jgi:putative DNA primase/helicase
MQDLLLQLRYRGIAVMMVHHAGKSGAQRGTSRREDVLDVSISLESQHDAEDDPGGSFKVVWMKRRGFSGTDCPSFEATLTIDADGVVVWSTAEAGTTRNELVFEEWQRILIETGKNPTQRALAENLSISVGTVNTAIRELRAQGRI